MRKRVNRGAVCSSENYETSKKLHLDMLRERHSHFCGIGVSGEISIDTPIVKDNALMPKYKTIRIFGKDMRITMEEYKIHCKDLGL